MNHTRVAGLLAGLVCAFNLAGAVADDSLSGALTNGKTSLDARYRIEYVKQDGFSRDALASTLRTRLDYQTGQFHGFEAMLGFQDLHVLGNTLYNSTDNGKTEYPVVADPQDTEPDQAYLAYAPDSTLRLAGGRQAILLDNQRFVGNVGFRQLQQTFDGLTANWSPDTDVSLFYAYLTRAHRVFGDHNTAPGRQALDLNTQLLNAKWIAPIGTFTAYAYLIGNDTASATSHKDLGIRYAGSTGDAQNGMKFFYSLECAHQNSYRDGAASINANYFDLEGGIAHQDMKAWIGQERLGGNGNYAFQTPLATLHAFDGWADRFLVTPVNGLRDTYLGVAHTNLAGGQLSAIYHDFRADHGGGKYGHELDLRYAHALDKLLTASVELADYSADSFAADTRIAWLTLQLKF
ncbi:MAG TPA: alginate export family protein [Gammaproteobacteria bacterium]